MDMQVNEPAADGPLKVTFKGRLDTAGTDRIETRFTAAVVAGGRDAMVDLSGLDLITSMGMRMLISAARAMSQRQLKLVLFGAQGLVAEALEISALDTLIATVADESAARSLLVR